MGKLRGKSATALLAVAGRQWKHQKYVLRLFVAGMTPRSQEAVRAVTTVCERNLAGRYHLDVIDLYQQPALAKSEQIFAVPTLVRKLPVPVRLFIGNMADKRKILTGLDIIPADA